MPSDSRTEIHLYDFDGTLFRSPLRPDWWPERHWWTNIKSLSAPCVPEVPGSDWWVEAVVSSARRSIQNPNVWAVLATGRNLKLGAFRYRIPELLQQKDLLFDEVQLNDTNDALLFKKRLLMNLLRKHNHVAGVQLWDDRPDFLEAYVELVERFGKEAIPHLVVADAHLPDCSLADVTTVATTIRVNGHLYELVGG